MKEKFVTIEGIPEWSVTYLMYGDETALDEEDKKQANEFMKKNGLSYLVDVEDEEGGFDTHPAFGLSTNTVTGIFAVKSESKKKTESICPCCRKKNESRKMNESVEVTKKINRSCIDFLEPDEIFSWIDTDTFDEEILVKELKEWYVHAFNDQTKYVDSFDDLKKAVLDVLKGCKVALEDYKDVFDIPQETVEKVHLQLLDIIDEYKD